jgi:IS1 family transposase
MTGWVGVCTERLGADEAWSFVGNKQKNVKRHEIHAKGDQYVFIAMAGTQKAIISWGVGKRNMDSTTDFLEDLRGRVIGQPEISTDGFHPYRPARRSRCTSLTTISAGFMKPCARPQRRPLALPIGHGALRSLWTRPSPLPLRCRLRHRRIGAVHLW